MVNQKNTYPLDRIQRGRKIVGMSAILLPFDSSGLIDWVSFRGHVERTIQAGLIPAVNMDTGYAHLLDQKTKTQVLQETKAIVGERSFVAGAGVKDHPGDPFNRDSYLRSCDEIAQYDGIPVIFQSFGLTRSQTEETPQQKQIHIVNCYHEIARGCSKFLAFELSTAFAAFGNIYDLETYRELIQIKACVGAKHSSLHRQKEWDRLSLRDLIRPDFMVLTGNDLAIDMVMYGSDYLLGLSTFAPDYFALRDRYWLEEDPRFFELNDILQYLGCFAFRAPVPAYKHSAAQFLKLRQFLQTDQTHPLSPTRPESDYPILQDILDQLEKYGCSLNK